LSFSFQYLKKTPAFALSNNIRTRITQCKISLRNRSAIDFIWRKKICLIFEIEIFMDHFRESRKIPCNLVVRPFEDFLFSLAKYKNFFFFFFYRIKLKLILIPTRDFFSRLLHVVNTCTTRGSKFWLKWVLFCIAHALNVHIP
jgi:hypothetical protein